MLDNDFLLKLKEAKEPFNLKFSRTQNNVEKLVKGDFEKEELEDLKNDILRTTSQMISICITKMLEVSNRNINQIAPTTNQEDDSLFGQMLLLLNREISFTRVEAPMAVSAPRMGEVEFTLEVNPLYLVSTLDNISDKYSEEEIQKSYETNDTEASYWYMNQIISILCHECLHLVYNHLVFYKEVFKKGSAFATAMNIATDCTINQLLSNLPQTKGLVTLDYVKSLSKNENLLENEASWVYYKAIIEELEKNPEETAHKMGQLTPEEEQKLEELQKKINGILNGSGEELTQEELEELGKAISSHKGWGSEDKEQEMPKELSTELLKNILEESMKNYEEQKNKSSKLRGNISSDLQKEIDRYFEKTNLDWKQILKRKIGNLAVPFKLSKNRVNRRQPFRPELKGKIMDRTVRIVFACDDSGSISAKTREYMNREIATLLSNYNFKIEVLEFDTVIRKSYEVEKISDISSVVPYGGGTSFQPIFDYVNDKKYGDRDTLLIIQTDGYGESTVNTKNFHNVLWLITDMEDLQSKFLSVKNPVGQVLALGSDMKYVELMEK